MCVCVCVCVCVLSNHTGSHIPSSWMIHAGCVFVAGVHPSKDMNDRIFGVVQWNACVSRLAIRLCSHP